jgi:hypothetical protein
MAFIYRPIIDQALNHQLSLWESGECYRFYIENRRAYCSFVEILNLWLRAPFCEECFFNDPFPMSRWPDITPSSWKDDMCFELGEDTLKKTLESLKDDNDYCFICKECGKELRPWE